MKKISYQKIFLKPYRGKIFLKNKVFEINNGSNIFYKFKQKIKKYNLEINTIDFFQEKQGNTVIYCDVPYPWEIRTWMDIVKNKSKNILFCFESPIINPFSQYKILAILFRRIYTWNDEIVDNRKYFKFYIPQLKDGLDIKPLEFEKKKFLILINSNKSVPIPLRLFALKKRNLYKERDRAIDFFEKIIPDDFYLYGRGWNKRNKLSLKDNFFGPKIRKSYRGEVENKLQLLSTFKFSLCFENTSANGYITEKIFDCFKAKCVPVYLGAQNIDKYIDKKCYIDLRNYNDYDELFSHLRRMDEKEYQSYIDNIDRFLKDKQIRGLWFEEGFLRVFLNSLL